VKHIKGNFLFKSCLPNSALKLSFDEETERERIMLFANDTRVLQYKAATLFSPTSPIFPPLQYLRTAPSPFKNGRKGALEKGGTR